MVKNRMTTTMMKMKINMIKKTKKKMRMMMGLITIRII